MIRIPTVLLLCAALSACQSATSSELSSADDAAIHDQADLDAEAKKLIQLDEDWSKAAATRDADRVASYYAEDALAYPPNEPVAVGKAAARKVWASYLAEPTFTISWKTSHAEVTRSGELGFTAGTYRDSFKGADGKLVNETGKYVCVWKRQKDGSWKAIHDIWNTDSK